MRTRGYLPHWEVDGGFYSITYRLHDSLPKEAVCALRDERRRILDDVAGRGRKPSFFEKLEVDRRFSMRLDAYLDQGRGACHLSRPPVARIVAENLRHLDGVRHELLAWCIMPNHVHTVMQLFVGQDLHRMLHSWKSFTSKKALRFLGCSAGTAFWQKEYFDRLIRDEEDLRDTIQYVVNNPLKAGLKDWPWVWRRE